MTLQDIINWFALILAVALTVIGIIGFKTGQVTAASYAFMNKEHVSGTKARVLSIAWIVFGLLGTAIFGGHLLGITAVAPLYDLCMSLLKSN
jgi:hypothetical protein